MLGLRDHLPRAHSRIDLMEFAGSVPQEMGTLLQIRLSKRD